MKKFVNSIFIVLFSILFFSCEIGLGEAVDTMPPEFTIVSPESESIIRDSFVVHGTWSDDGEIESVTLTLTRTDGSGKVYGPFPGEITLTDKKEGTWSCVVNPAPANGERILDGTYEAEIALTDAGEHTTKSTRQLSIDNTPPLLILQRPVTDISAKDADTYEYGQLFTLEGQVSDDSNVHHIDIDVYKDAKFTNHLQKITIDNVSSTINIDVARFADGGAYTNIYGYSSIDEAENANQLSAVRFCKITTYDNAKRYPAEGNESVEDSHGNSTSEFYVYSDVNTSDLLGKYKITELYKMQNGTYGITDSSRAADTGGVLGSLVSKKKGASKFRLNPKNNPIFSVSGKPTTISNNSNIVVEVKPGLDGYVLQKDSLRPYIIACDSKGKLLVDDTSANRIYLADAGDCEKNGSNYKFVTEFLQGKTAAAYATSHSEANMLLVNHYYLFGCEGSDIKGKSVMSDGLTVFKFESNENSNRLSASVKVNDNSWAEMNGNDLYIKNDSVIHIKGEAIGVDTEVSSLISVKINGSKDHVALTVDTAAKTMKEGYYTQPFTATINVADLALTSGHDYTVEVSAGTPISDLNATVKYDNEVPTFAFGIPSPYAPIYKNDWEWAPGTTDAEKNERYLNKTVTVNVAVFDNDAVSKATIEVQKQNGVDGNGDPVFVNVPELTRTATSNFSSWDVSIDTTKLTDNALMRMVVTATDRSGNTGTATSAKYTVWQDSDKPSAVSSETCLKENPAASEMNKSSPGGSLSIILYDDDGVKTVKAELYKDDVLQSDKTQDLTITDSDITEKYYYTYKVDKTLASGKYKIQLTLKDKNGCSVTIPAFPLKITAPDPIVTVIPQVDIVTTSEDANVQDPVRQVVNKIKVISTGSPFKIERFINGEPTGTVVKPQGATDDWCHTGTANSSEHEFTDSFEIPSKGIWGKKVDEDGTETWDYITPVSGEYSIRYRVTDSDGKTEPDLHYGDGEAKFQIDNDKPKVTINTVPTTAETETPTGKLEGTAEETGTYKSGLRKVQYKIQGDSNTEITDAIDTTKWKSSIIFENHSALATEGKKKVMARAIDKVGNLGDWAEKEFNYDTNKPENVEITSYTKTDNTTAAISSKIYYGYKFSLSGTAQDSNKLKDGTTNSGTACVEVYQNGVLIDTVDVTAGKWTVANLPRDPNNVGEFAADPVEHAKDPETKVALDGEYTYYIKAFDDVGKNTSSEEITMSVDHEAPEVTIATIGDSNGIINGTSYRFKATANDNHTVNGAVVRGSGVDKIYYSFDTAVTESSSHNGGGETLAQDKFLATGTETDGDNLTEGEHTIYVRAEDKAGNYKVVSKTFKVDQGRPEVALTVDIPEYLNANTGDSLTLKGTVKETNKLKSFKIEGPATPKEFTVGADKEIPATLLKDDSWTKAWEYTHSSIPEGKVTYKFIAEDIVGNKNLALTKEVFVDITAPAVAAGKFNLPNVNNTQEEFFTFSGNAGCIAEAGSGIESVEIGFSNDSATTPADVASKDAAEVVYKTDGSWTCIVEFSKFNTFKTSGPKKVWLRATDKAGNTCAWVPSASWTYDTKVPESTLVIEKDSEIVNIAHPSYTIKGVATDDYGIKSLTLTAKNKTTGETKTLNLTKTPATLTKTSPAKTVTWEWNSTSNELTADGEYTFTLTGEDWAQLPNDTKYKSFTLTDSVTVDTKAPEIEADGITTENETDKEKIKITGSGGSKDGQTWYNTQAIKLKVKPKTGDLTGIESVAYSTTTDANRQWVDLAVNGDYDKGTAYYTGTVTVPDQGANTVYFRITDKAGNVNYSNDSKYETYLVDTIAPEIGTVYDELGNELKGEVYIDGNVQKNYVIYVKADSTEGDTEKATGIKALSVEETTSETATIPGQQRVTGYKITIPYANLSGIAKNGLAIVATDYVNNEKAFTPFKLTVDNIDPVIDVKTPAVTNDTTKALNGKITISADISDYLKIADKSAKKANGKLKKIEVRYSIETDPDDDDDWYPIDSSDSKQPTTAKDSIEITHQFSEINKHLAVNSAGTALELVADTSSTPAIQNVWVRIQATDQANHTTENKFKMIVDRNSDRPVIEFNNVEMGSDMYVPGVNGGAPTINYKWLSGTTLLQGTVTDDDGVESIYLSLDGTDWKQANLTGNNWNFDVQKFYGSTISKTTERSANGIKTIYFKVTDKKEDGTTGNTFISKADNTTTAFNGIYLRSTVGATDYNYSLLYVKPETLAPRVEITGGKVDGDANYSTNYSTMYLGGEKHGFSLQFTASDENGISDVSVTASFTKDDGTSSSVTAVKATTTGTDNKVTGPVNGVYTATFTKFGSLKTSGEAGSIEFTVSAKDYPAPDNSRETQDSKRIKYDYKFPEPSITTPKYTESDLTTTAQVGNVTAQGEVSESSEIWYALSLNNTDKPGSDATNAPLITRWTGHNSDATGATVSTGGTIAAYKPVYQHLSNMASGWTIYFDGTRVGVDEDHGIRLKDFLCENHTKITTDAAITAQSFTDIVDVYLWIKAKDARGNITETPFLIRVDSQGERPEASIAYPGTANEIVANTVTIYGSAKPADNNEMQYVWVQLVSTKHEMDGFTNGNGRNYGNPGANGNAMTVDLADLDYMAAAGYSVYNMKKYRSYTDAEKPSKKWVAGTSTLETGYNASDYGILIDTNGSTGWNLKINNDKKEFDASETNPVGIAVYAQDKAGHISQRVTQYLSFDSDSPKITDVFLKKADGTVREYTDNMWISGSWNLTYTLTDNEKIIQDSVQNQANASYDKSADDRKWKVTVPVTSAFKNAEIAVYDKNAQKPTKKTIKINIDNTAPSFVDTNENFVKEVKNSNGYYTFGTAIDEKETSVDKGESGIDYIAFYIRRGNDVYDVMYKNSKETINSADDTDHLRWTTSTISSVSANKITLIEANKYAHVGGLIKVKGTIYKITGVSGAEVTIDGNLESGTTGDAYVAIANVVNNTVKESAGGTKETDSTKYAYGYGVPSLDDGDRMIEYLAKDGSWTAQINSRNIPDGPITLCCVAFDKAGNASALKEKELYVSNNAPRIAGITINTDLNGNDKFKNSSNEWEEGEHITKYNAANASSGSVTGTASGSKNIYDPDENPTGKNVKNALAKIFTIGKASEGFTIFKGRTEIIPEIVGGNGAVTYDFTWQNKAGGTGAETKLSGTDCGTVVATGSTDYTAVTGNAINIQVGDLVEAGDTVKTGSATEAPHLLTITFRDSTKNGTSSTRTNDDKTYQSAELKMYFGVDVVAEGAPTAGIDDFFWKSATDNSVYDSTNKKIIGHIELPEELPATFTDRDAKVSGTVILTGTASDSGKITELYFYIDGMTLTGDKTKTVDGKAYERLAVDVDNVLTSKDPNLTITNSYTAEKHEVTWKYIWNTENISETAQNDVAVKVMAVNQGKPDIDEDNDNGTNLSIDGKTKYAAAEYSGESVVTDIKVDVVPYITELVTTLSNENPENSSEYGRSALGSYPVFYYTNGSTEKDTIEVKGYNLKAGDNAVKLTASSGNVTTKLTSANSKFTFQLPATAKSGEVSVVVNGVESLNNKNNNNALGGENGYDPTKLSSKKRGTYTEYRNYYNRQPNNINNDNLTDDVKLAIWDLDAAAISVTSDLTRPVMHVNPNNGMVGFAYSNGDRFYMPNGSSNRQTHWSTAWNAFNSIGFTYDTKGNTFGVEMGTDSNDTVNSKFRILASVWGTAGSHEYGNYHALRLESHHGNATRFDTHPKLVATNPDANNANVYLMYYDPEPDEPTNKTNPGDKLKLRCGTIPLKALTFGSQSQDDTPARNTTDVFGDFSDDAWQHSSNKPSGATGPYNPTDYTHCAVVASSNSGTYKPGTEYSIAVVPAGTISGITTDTLVVVWVDPIRDSLIYGYMTAPMSNSHPSNTSTTYSIPTDNWHFTEFCAGYAGGSCAVTTDSAGGVHIAYYSTERNGSLKYTYLETPASASSASTCFVDSYGTTGRNVTIDYAYDSVSKKYVPYIGYYNSMGKPKYAYLNTTSSRAPAGSNDQDYFSTAWEAMFIPSVSLVDATDGIQLGVYRDTSNSNILKAITSGNGGNGTANPIIGYANGSSKFETAQLK